MPNNELVPDKGQNPITPEFIAAKKAETHRRDRYTTIVFDDEEQWARFLKQVFRQRGLSFTDSPLPMSARLEAHLLESTYQEYPMRLVTPEEERRYLDSLEGDRPFHPDTFKNRPIPAVEYFIPED